MAMRQSKCDAEAEAEADQASIIRFTPWRDCVIAARSPKARARRRLRQTEERPAATYSRPMAVVGEYGQGITWLTTTPRASLPSSDANACVPTKDTLQNMPEKPACLAARTKAAQDR